MVNPKPDFISGKILKQIYDGKSDDLLTAGLGKDGLGSAEVPAFQDPENPTSAELRRLAIVDTSPGGGYSRISGNYPECKNFIFALRTVGLLRRNPKLSELCLKAIQFF